MKLQEFLIELLTVTDRFKDVVTHIMLKNAGDHVVAAAKSRDGSVTIMAKSKGPVEEFQDVACLGSLTFLLRSLSTGSMRKGNLKLNYDTASDGKTTTLRSIELTGEAGFNVFYQAVDPFINQLNRIKTPTDLNWPVVFGIDKPFMSRFDEVYKVHAQAPKVGTDMDDIFTLTFSDSEISCSFGDKGHQASVGLTKEVETTGATDKVNSLFSASRFVAILKLVDKNAAVGFLSDKALKVDIHTSNVEYQFVASAKKVSR